MVRTAMVRTTMVRTTMVRTTMALGIGGEAHAGAAEGDLDGDRDPPDLSRSEAIPRNRLVARSWRRASPWGEIASEGEKVLDYRTYVR